MIRALAVAGIAVAIGSCGHRPPAMAAPALTPATAVALVERADDVLRSALQGGDASELSSVFAGSALESARAAAAAARLRGAREREHVLSRGLVHVSLGFGAGEAVLMIRTQVAAAGPSPSISLRQWWTRLRWLAGRWMVVDDRDLSPPQWW